MKNFFLFSFILLFYQISFSQEPVTILKSNEAISFLLKPKNDLYTENYTLQYENTTNRKAGITIEKHHGFKYLFDGQTLVTFLNNKITIYTISDDLNGDNVIKGYGMSKREGKFKIKTEAINNTIVGNNDIFSVIESVK